MREVGEAELAALTEQSQANTPSVEALFGPAPAPAARLGDYEILGELGRGGMGVVYLALQLSLGRLVALKMLPGDLSGDQAALARFRREIRALARCDHPNIVKVLARGELPDGRLYYAMEYVPGCDLEQVWRELSGSAAPGDASHLGGSSWAEAVLSASRKRREAAAARPAAPTVPLPPLPELPGGPDDPGGYVRRVAGLMRDAALALQTVRDQHLVHRDVKPANLMLTPDGLRVVLMDFGLAKGESLTTPESRAGGLLGTLRYAAPEQLASANVAVGPEADVRGLGVTLWEMLTRRRLFAEAGDENQLAQQVLTEDTPPLRRVDASLGRDLEAIVARATERRVADRIPTARRLAEYLQLYLDGRPLPIRPPGPRERAWRWSREHKTLVGLAAAAAAAVLLAAVAGVIGIAWHKAEIEKERADTLSADLSMQQGMALDDAGDPAQASLQFAEALRQAPDGSPPKAAARTLFTSAVGRVHALVNIYEYPANTVRAVDLSPDGKKMLLGGNGPSAEQGPTAYLVDVETGEESVLEDRSDKPRDSYCAGCFSPDGRRVLLACDGPDVAGKPYEGSARVRDLSAGTVLEIKQPGLKSAVLSPKTGDKVLVCAERGAAAALRLRLARDGRAALPL